MLSQKWVRTLRLTGAALVALAALQVGWARAEGLSTALPPQPLAAALEKFAASTGLQLVYSAELARGVTSPGAGAGRSAEETLRELLRDTGLTFEFLNERTVAVTSSVKSTERSTAPASKSEQQPPGAWSRLMGAFRLAQADEATDAQGVQSDSDAAEPSRKPNVAVVEEVVVTGSHLRKAAGEVTDFPLYSITLADLEHRGVNRLADLRTIIPQLGASIGFNDHLTEGGPSKAQATSTSFNLRGLGGNSTLVLIDGRRLPRTGQEAAEGAGGREDFNVDGIPVSAIERIDILPQGAGAVYGADAMAGVINIILEKNYSGFETRVSYDSPSAGGAVQRVVNVTGGYTADKWSTFLSASWDDQARLAASDRWFTATNDLTKFGNPNGGLEYSPNGGTGALSSEYTPSETSPELPGLATSTVAIPRGSNGSSATLTDYAAAGTPAGNFDSAPYAAIIDPARRASAVLSTEYAFTPATRAYVEGRWSRFENFSVGTPVELTTELPEGYPGNPFPGPVFLRKVFFDLPLPEIDSTQENTGLSTGVRGNFLSDWRYDVGASWARNVVTDKTIQDGSFDFDALSTAMADPETRPILAYDSTQPGANPNPAGRLESLLTQTGIRHEDTSDVYQLTGVADGAIAQGWAGDVKLAVGAETQEEKVKFHRDERDVNGFDTLKDPFSRHISAGFSELRIPLLSENQGIPLVRSVAVSGAARYENYSDLGGHTTYSYSALYQPKQWLSLRASRTEGFKAPRLYDLRGPVYDLTLSLRASRGVVDTLRGGVPVVGTFDGILGGSLDLKPETSVSRDIGIVLDVPFVPGLSFAVDRWHLNYDDKVGIPNYQDLIDFFPERVTRAPTSNGTPGVITGFDLRNINETRLETEGVDYRLSYQRTFGFGGITLGAAVSDPKPIVLRATPLAKPESEGVPRRLSGSLFWSSGPWEAGTSFNYQSGFLPSPRVTVGYPSYIEWNPQVSWDSRGSLLFGPEAGSWWARTFAGSRASLTIVNVFNHEPSLQDAAYGRVVQDPRLRRYIFTFAKSF